MKNETTSQINMSYIHEMSYTLSREFRLFTIVGFEGGMKMTVRESEILLSHVWTTRPTWT